MEVKLPEDVAEGFQKKFGPLLAESGSSRDFLWPEIKIFQKFMADAATFHGEGKEQVEMFVNAIEESAKNMPGNDKFFSVNIREYLALGNDEEAGEPALVELLSDW